MNNNQPELTLQHKVVLSLFKQIPKVYGRTRIQKLIFLYQIERASNSGFNFKKHHYGPYSKLLKSIQQELIDFKLIDEISSIRETKNGPVLLWIISITKKGERIVQQALPKEIDEVLMKEIVDQFGFMNQHELIDFVYNNYPQYKPIKNES